MTRLSTLIGDGTSSYSRSSSSASSGVHGFNAKDPWKNHSSAESSTSGEEKSHTSGAGTGVAAPEGEVTIVFSDITRAASLWEFNPLAMKDATLLHNSLLRTLLKKHHGYEVLFIRDRNSGEGSFCMAFQETIHAVEWCEEVQQELVKAEWPEALLEHPGASEEWGDTDDRVIFKGLRVRMGVHVGKPRVVNDPTSRKIEYMGPCVNIAARITALTHSGQVYMLPYCDLFICNSY